MEKRTLQISLGQAKNWYEGTNEELKQLALDTFPELGKKELPKTWEELIHIKGFYHSVQSRINSANCLTFEDNKSIFATKEQAEASIALAQLSQLRKVYQQGWVPDWSDTTQKKYIIHFIDNKIQKTNLLLKTHNFLVFEDEETRDLFLENFRDLIEKAKPLMS